MTAGTVLGPVARTSGTWSWALLALLVGIGLALDTWWVRYRTLPSAPEPITLYSGELDPNSLGRLEVAPAAQPDGVMLRINEKPGGGAVRWRWTWPDGADAVQVSGLTSFALEQEGGFRGARAYVWFRQPAESAHPMAFPVADLRGSESDYRLDGKTARLQGAISVELMVGYFRSMGELQLQSVNLQWLEQRKAAKLVWCAAIVGWIFWLACLAWRWWQATTRLHRWWWPAIAVISTPLFFSMEWLTRLREGIHGLTGVHITAILPFDLVIGEVVHFSLFFGLTLAVAWLMPLRPWRTRVLELAALATATEFVQEYIPGRSLKLQDWATNLAGIACALLLLAAWHALRARRAATPP